MKFKIGFEDEDRKTLHSYWDNNFSKLENIYQDLANNK